MHQDVERILLSETELSGIVDRLAVQINRDYADKHLLLLCILKGSVLFMADLMKRITLPTEIDFMQVSSYDGGTKTTGHVRVVSDMECNDVAAYDVLIVEDILDTGRTLSYLKNHLQQRGAKSVKACTLLDKPERREIPVTADYVGAVIPDEFVAGYGLDYNEQYRTLPYVGVLRPSVYGK